jgi:hypothetical protein
MARVGAGARKSVRRVFVITKGVYLTVNLNIIERLGGITVRKG